MREAEVFEKDEGGGDNLPVLAIVFSILSPLALLFVFWLGFSSFENNSFDMTRNLYSTLLRQSVSDIESATRYGKTLESYFGIDQLLLQTTSLMGDGVTIAVTDTEGNLLHSLFDEDSSFSELIRTEQVRSQIVSGASDSDGITFTSGGYEILIMPIYGLQNRQSGNMCLIYPARDPSFGAEHGGVMLVMTLIVAICVVVAILGWLLFIKKTTSDRAKKYTGIVPVLILTAGILVQSAVSFFTYQTQYRSMMFDSAKTVSAYMESLVSQVRDKGVPYEQMYGLDEFFADKLRQMPTLWDIKLISIWADSQDVIFRENEYTIHVPIRAEEKWDMRLAITISSQYINRRMSETLLLSFITLIVCVLAIVEIMRLPELIMLRISRDFNRPVKRQWAGLRSGLRLSTFLLYTGVFIVKPYLAMLVRQWRQPMFGLSLDVSAGIPLTMDAFALLVGTLVSAFFYKRVKIKFGLGVSILVFIAANITCVFIMNPYYLSALRFFSGIGFSGILYSTNYIVSYGTRGENKGASALAGINSGLLGGVMVGAALGAIIASALGVALCFVIAACFCLAAGVIRFTLTPWKLLASEVKEAGAASEKSRTKREGIAKTLLHPKVLVYLLLVMAPLSLGLAFVVAGMPALSQSNGLSPLILSSAYIANGIAGIYLGAPLLKLLMRNMRGNLLMAAVIIVGGVAIGAVFLPPIWFTILLCAFLLGIFDGVGTPTNMVTFLDLPGISSMRQVDALVVGNTIMRSVNSLTPMAYGFIIAAATGSAGVFAILGGAYIIAGAFYMFISKKRS